MRGKVSSLIICLILILALFIGIDMHFEWTSPVKGAVIYVGGGGPGNLSTIQEGVNAAIDGDTVFVYNGTYFGPLTINKMISVVGEDRNISVIDNTMPFVSTVSIEANWVNISGFTIKNGSEGIFLQDYHNCSIYGNIVTDTGQGLSLWGLSNGTIIGNLITSNGYGIDLQGSDNNIIIHNTVIDNSDRGIHLWGATENLVANNYVSSNAWGIYLYGSMGNNITNNDVFSNELEGMHISHWSDGNNITQNTVSSNNESGIIVFDYCEKNYIINNTISNNNDYGIGVIDFSHNNLIENNNIIDNGPGIYIQGSINNTLYDNFVSNNSDRGIYLWAADGNHIFGNDVSSNAWGIHLNFSMGNDIMNNTVSLSNDYGILITDSSDNNLIYHNNIINNANQANDTDPANNDWHHPVLLEGNFWSDYQGEDDGSGTGKHAIAGDGIGDTEIPHPAINYDFYPLMAPFGNCILLSHGWNLISIPLVQDDTNLEHVLAPLRDKFTAVQHYNNSNNIETWKHNHISKPLHLNDLKEIDITMGFFIYITVANDTVFIPGGLRPSHNHNINLHKGWNMVGYPSLSNKYRPDALNNLVFGTHVDSVWAFNAATQTWEEIGPLDNFELGKGYWIHATQDCVWEVPL